VNVTGGTVVKGIYGGCHSTNSISNSKMRPAFVSCRLRRERCLALPLEMLRISSRHPCRVFQFSIKDKGRFD
jgi:hypothetical protein